MMSLYRVWILFSFVVQALGNRKAVVDVFFNPLCSDTQQFFFKELRPFWSNPELRSKVSLTLYAGGKGSCAMGRDGVKRCQCEFGPEDCLASIAMLCAKDADWSNHVRFSLCLQANLSHLHETMLKCAEKMGYKGSELEACVAGAKGIGLLEKGFARNPPGLDYVPWINIDWKRSTAAERNLTDLFKTRYPFCESVCDGSPVPGSRFALILSFYLLNKCLL